jgi:hypothetical protein
MKILRNYLVLLCLTVFSICSVGQGYEIKIKVNGLTDKKLILGHYLSKSMFPDDTVKLDSKGYGVFRGNKKLPGGMYLIYLPSSRYFDIVIGDDQIFTIETDTLSFVNSMVIKGSEENQVFLDFQRYMASLRMQADSLTQMIKSQSDLKVRESLTAKLKKINNDRIGRIESIKKDHPTLFIADFLKATLDVVVPDPPKDEKGVVKDSTWQYFYYRNHYFDNFNISDPRLLRTPLYEDKIMTYLTKVVPQIPDSLIPQVDYFI